MTDVRVMETNDEAVMNSILQQTTHRENIEKQKN